MRVLVCGGRDFYNKALLKKTLDEFHALHTVTCIIHGGASGADSLAKHWTVAYGGMPHEEYQADWSLGRGAGPLRNALMLKAGKPDIVIAFKGGKGTADMIRKARSAGLKVIEVRSEHGV